MVLGGEYGDEDAEGTREARLGQLKVPCIMFDLKQTIEAPLWLEYTKAVVGRGKASLLTLQLEARLDKDGIQ